MKEKEAKKIAAKKRLEDKNKKKTEEENAARKEEAQQVFNSFGILIILKYLKSKLVINCVFTYFTTFAVSKIIPNFFRLSKDGKRKKWNILKRKTERRKNMKKPRNRKRRKLLLRKGKIT